jgi:hypothetical protein
LVLHLVIFLNLMQTCGNLMRNSHRRKI